MSREGLSRLLTRNRTQTPIEGRVNGFNATGTQWMSFDDERLLVSLRRSLIIKPGGHSGGSETKIWYIPIEEFDPRGPEVEPIEVAEQAMEGVSDSPWVRLYQTTEFDNYSFRALLYTSTNLWDSSKAERSDTWTDTLEFGTFRAHMRLQGYDTRLGGRPVLKSHTFEVESTEYRDTGDAKLPAERRDAVVDAWLQYFRQAELVGQ